MSLRRPPLRSQQGCQVCRHRRKKCDERKPVCGACETLNFVCQWGSKCHRDNSRGIKAAHNVAIVSFAPSHRRSLRHNPRLQVTTTESACLDFFWSQVLPVFTLCQPGAFQASVLGFLVYSNATFRQIVTAIAANQRPCHHSGDSDATYQHALCSWRVEISKLQFDDAPVIVTGCLLFIIIESLRKNYDGIILHLRNTVHIANLACRNPAAFQPMRPFLGLLQSLCTSIWLYSQFQPGRKDLGEIMDIRLQGGLLFLLQGQEDSQLEVNWLIQELMETRYTATARCIRGEPLNHFQHLQELKYKARQLCIRLHTNPQFGANSVTVRAKSIILDFELRGRPSDHTEYPQVLGIIEEAIALLKTGNQPVPFSIGLDIINTVEMVVSTCADETEKRRALAVLDECPANDGPWNARVVQSVLVSR